MPVFERANVPACHTRPSMGQRARGVNARSPGRLGRSHRGQGVSLPPQAKQDFVGMAAKSDGSGWAAGSESWHQNLDQGLKIASKSRAPCSTRMTSMPSARGR